MDRISEEHVRELENRIDYLRANERVLLYWLLRSHQSNHREGWEESPTVQETMEGLHSVLCNFELDPNEEEGQMLLKRKPAYPPLDLWEIERWSH